MCPFYFLSENSEKQANIYTRCRNKLASVHNAGYLLALFYSLQASVIIVGYGRNIIL